jgi:ABC-2 type transport system ATP-binding protein
LSYAAVGEPRSSSAVLEIAGVSRRFGEHVVVEDISLNLGAGERAALIGPNGAGKSTLLRMTAGALLPTTGTVMVGGDPADSIAARRRSGVSLSQERSFYLRLSGRANLRFFAALRGLNGRAATSQVDALIDELSLSEFADQPADRYSTGMILQLAFARALIGDPDLLVLDEPTRSLDRAASDRLWAAIDRRPRLAVLIATHQDRDLTRCGQVLEIDKRR